MYGPFFNIDESAFSIAPNPKYLYLSKQHEEALAHLVYGVTRKGGFVCLTGDIGTGKTTVCRCMFEQLPENTDIAFVINPKFSPMELLASICDELHLGYSTFQPSIKEYVKKLYTYLIEAHGKGRSTVLVIDEAQNLSVEALEHIRSLTNLETNDQKLLQIILIGQPELKTMLARPELEQVNQRITARFHIGPLSLKEANRYINHRLLVAGAKQKIFSTANIKQIYKLTKGVPRRINILCDRILLGAFTLGKSKISSNIIKQSAEEVFDNVSSYSEMLPKALAASIVAVLISAAAVFTYQNNKFDSHALLGSFNTPSEDKIALATDASELNVIKKQAITAKKNVVEEVETVEKVEINPVIEKQINEKKANYIAEESNDQVPVIENKIVKNTMPLIKPDAQNTTSSKPENNKQKLQLTSYGKAYQQLFRLWAVDYSSEDVTPCEHANNNKLQCYKDWGNIDKVISLNRPVLLRGKVEDIGPNYIVVVSIEGEHAVVSEKGDYKLVAISEIEANWNGEFEMLWRPLKSGVIYISPGQQGQAIALLDEKLAKLQGREPSAPHPFIYSEDLVNQVRAFQIANNLPSDGVVGPITQMHFNNSETIDTPFLIK